MQLRSGIAVAVVRPAATAPIGHLAWRPPYAAGVALIQPLACERPYVASVALIPPGKKKEKKKI